MNIDTGESGCMVDTGWTFHKDYVQLGGRGYSCVGVVMQLMNIDIT